MAINDLPSDNPELGFEKYASILANEIDSTSPPQLTVGVFGGYGEGKTTLMRAIARDLSQKSSEDHKYILVEFDAWRFDREESLLAPFVLTIAEVFKTIGKKEVSLKLLAAARALAYGVKLKLGPLSFSGKDMIEREKQLKSDTDVSELDSEYFSSLKYLTELPSSIHDAERCTIVVLIDDLDRCWPEKAFELLESIKAVMGVAGYVFIIGLDPRVINKYLKIKYGENHIEEYGLSAKEYLEKIIQVPFYLPPLSEDDIKAYLTQLDTGIDEIAMEAISNSMPRNIRKIKRLLNTAAIIQSIDNSTLDYQVLIILLILKDRWSDCFSAIQKYKFKFISLYRCHVDPEEDTDIPEGYDDAIKIIEVCSKDKYCTDLVSINLFNYFARQESLSDSDEIQFGKYFDLIGQNSTT